MGEEHTSLQNVNYKDQIDILLKHFLRNEIGAIIIHSLQKEKVRETGENLDNFRKERAKDLKARLNEAISATRSKDFDKEKFYTAILNGINKNKQRMPRDINNMCNERLYTSLYKLSLKMNGFTPVFLCNVVDIIYHAQPNAGDKDILKHYNYSIDDVVRNYLAVKTENIAAA